MPGSDLLTAIEGRKRQWHVLQRKRTPPSEKERQILAVLQGNLDAAKAWTRLTRPSGRWTRKIDHDEVLRLLLRSADIANNPETHPYSDEAVKKRFEDLKKACSLLLDYFSAEAGLYSEEIDYETPLDEDRPWVFQTVHRLWCILDYLVVEENHETGTALWTPSRSAIKNQDRAARVFEHVFSTYLHRGFERPFDEFVLDISRLVFPDARPLEDVCSLFTFRQQERERHARMMKRYLQERDAE